jgi:hypothetical protein
MPSEVLIGSSWRAIEQVGGAGKDSWDHIKWTISDEEGDQTITIDFKDSPQNRMALGWFHPADSTPEFALLCQVQ